MRSWWKVECPQGSHQFSIDLCSDHTEIKASSTLRPLGGAGGRVMPPLPFCLGAYKSRSVSVEFMQDMMCWIVNASTGFQIVMHGQL